MNILRGASADLLLFSARDQPPGEMGVFAGPLVLVATAVLTVVVGYDPNDPEVSSVIPPQGTFEAFYPRGEGTGSSRAAHSHGSFYKHRNPALVDAKNAAAYGFRFDGGRRFNY